jgi:hypothetical protein
MAMGMISGGARTGASPGQKKKAQDLTKDLPEKK